MREWRIGLVALCLGSALPAAAQPAAVAPTEIAVGEALPGAFFATPEGSGPFPTIILLGGSEGGDGGARAFAPRFMAQGYAVLGLPYYAPTWPGQPSAFPQLPAAFADIPVEKAHEARRWLCARQDVECGNIGLYGVSKGAEFALLAGSLEPGFAAIAAIVPTDVVWEGWGAGTTEGQSSSFSWKGKPLPFVPYIGMNEEIAKFAIPGAKPRIRLPQDRGRHANPDRAVAARIKVEDIGAPVLVAGGDADQVWNSGEMAQAIAERRAAANLPTVSLIYTDAGHNLSGDGANAGGQLGEADVAAQKEIWPATLAFFERHLKD